MDYYDDGYGFGYGFGYGAVSGVQKELLGLVQEIKRLIYNCAGNVPPRNLQNEVINMIDDFIEYIRENGIDDMTARNAYDYKMIVAAMEILREICGGRKFTFNIYDDLLFLREVNRRARAMGAEGGFGYYYY